MNSNMLYFFFLCRGFGKQGFQCQGELQAQDMCLCLVCKSPKSSEPVGVQDSVLWIWCSHKGSLIFEAKVPSAVRPACILPHARSPAQSGWG